ncbi:MAG TPA: protein phosphatase CheZ [Nitrospiraceae bacterium]|nr:protein phosphatase CheZ [Nitrospiraceae bacterium]
MNDSNRKLYGELGELTRYIENTMRQLRCVDVPVEETTAQLPQASEHLSDLAKLTEEGTHRVMELTEEVQDNRRLVAQSLTELGTLSTGSPHDAQADRIAAITALLTADDKRLMDIMTALSFQDLVAQRIKKIITILDDVEHKLLQMVVVFGAKQNGTQTVNGKADQMLKELEASRSTALKQDLVDDILGQFGFN